MHLTFRKCLNMLKFQHSLGSCSDKFVLMKKKEWRQPFSQFAVCLSSWITRNFQWFLQRTDYFVQTSYKLIFRITFFTYGNIFFTFLFLKALSIRRSLVTTLMMLFLQLELHSLSHWGTLKTAAPDFVLELEHPKLEELTPFITI